MQVISEPVRRRPIFGATSAAFSILAIILPVIFVALFAAEQQDKPDPGGWGWLAAVLVAIVLVVAVVGIGSRPRKLPASLTLARDAISGWPSSV